MWRVFWSDPSSKKVSPGPYKGPWVFNVRRDPCERVNLINDTRCERSQDPTLCPLLVCPSLPSAAKSARSAISSQCRARRISHGMRDDVTDGR
jgi:hypothetical protein